MNNLRVLRNIFADIRFFCSRYPFRLSASSSLNFSSLNVSTVWKVEAGRNAIPTLFIDLIIFFTGHEMTTPQVFSRPKKVPASVIPFSCSVFPSPRLRDKEINGPSVAFTFFFKDNSSRLRGEIWSRVRRDRNLQFQNKIFEPQMNSLLASKLAKILEKSMEICGFFSFLVSPERRGIFDSIIIWRALWILRCNVYENRCCCRALKNQVDDFFFSCV